jgi:class 3 adenylate cyclase
MRVIKFFCLFLCLLPSSVLAQPVLKINSGQKVLIGTDISYFIDSTNQLTINNVKDKSFSKGQNEILNFGNTSYNVWMKFSVQSHTEQRIYLEIVDPLLDSLDVYQVADSKFDKLFTGGWGLPFHHRPIVNENWLFDLHLQPDTVNTFYIKVHSEFPIQVPILLSAKDAFVKYFQDQNLFWGIYIGIMIFAFFYNLFIYLAIKERTYLYYILYIIGSSLFYLGLVGYDFRFFWPNIPALNPLIPVFICFTNVAVTLFTLRFLQVTKKQKVQFYGGWSLIIIFTITAIINFAGAYMIATGLAQLLSVVACIYYIYAGIASLKRRVPTAKYFLIGWLLFLVLVIICILALNNVIASNFFTTHCLFIGHMTEVILLSFALADRINWLKAENEKNQKEVIHQLKMNEQIQLEANRMLEQKVQERTQEVVEQRNEAINQRKRSDELLLNILPAETAEELKTTGTAHARYMNEVTVMFTDIKNFTQFSEELNPSELVAEINETFSAFDHILEKYNVEKIKTSGDSYMAAGGLPTPNATHATDVIKASLEIMKFMNELKEKKIAQGKKYFEIRLGVHSGPVVAGIVGIKKFAYDIWGDTVNIASRMESSGEVGKINISASTYNLVKDQFICNYRGKVQAKHKGMIDMYFVEGERNG